MKADEVTTYTRLLKNLWNMYAVCPDDRKAAIYADIMSVCDRMSEASQTAVIDNLILM